MSECACLCACAEPVKASDIFTVVLFIYNAYLFRFIRIGVNAKRTKFGVGSVTGKVIQCSPPG